MAGYAIINSFLKQQVILNDYLDMRSTHATIYWTVAVSMVQKFVRRPGGADEYRGVALLPDTMLGSISRRAIASATGLPRETVRRVVGDLLASGHLIEVGRSGVMCRRGELLSEDAQAGVLRLAKEISSLVDELSRLGVIVAR